MTSIEYMRGVVKNMYKSDSWARRVKGMSDNQVMAIYMKKVGGSTPKQKKPRPPENDLPF